jgi:hypothetical protein
MHVTNRSRLSCLGDVSIYEPFALANALPADDNSLLLLPSSNAADPEIEAA